jgi:hypothetical protein
MLSVLGVVARFLRTNDTEGAEEGRRGDTEGRL